MPLFIIKCQVINHKGNLLGKLLIDLRLNKEKSTGARLEPTTFGLMCHILFTFLEEPMETDEEVVQEKSPKVKKEVSSPVSSKTVKKTQEPEDDKKTPSKETKTPAKNFFG